jgi:hypothetical protein
LILKFFTQKGAFQLLVLEAVILLFIGRMSVLLFPFKWIAPWLGEFNKETDLIDDDSYRKKLAHIFSAIHATSKYTFWKSNCLAQALCCQWMLKRRKIPYTIYMGVRNDKDKQLLAHAWTRVGSKIVTGAFQYQRYTVTGKFAHFA